MKNKFIALSAVIVLIGIIIIATLGFNVDLAYRNYNFIGIKIGQDFSVSDVEKITKEVFKNQKVKVQKSGVYSDNVVIKVEDVNDEQKETLNTKINEKYGIENKIEDMEVSYIPSYRLRDLIKNYIVPVAISGVLTVAYLAIKYKKVGVADIIAKSIYIPVLAELTYLALVAITRCPFGKATIAVGLIIYFATITILTKTFEEQLDLKKQQNQ